MKWFYLLLLLLFFSCSDKLTGYNSIETMGLDSDTNGSSDSSSIIYEPGVITVGEWSDLDNWSFFQSLLNTQDYSEYATDWNFTNLRRVSVVVTSQSNEVVINEPVTLLKNGEIVWSSRTNNKGTAELWIDNYEVDLSSYVIEVGEQYISPVVPYSEGVNTVTISSNSKIINSADISFVIDATGSMSDELEYLKTELLDVISRVESTNKNIEVRTSSIVYRDCGDEYITRLSDFSSQLSITSDFIQKQSANGGGDWPEAVHSALDEAVNQLTWNYDSRSKILFLLLDAPPHSDPQIIDNVLNSVEKASGKGIRIIPIAASGIDKSTEFLLRFISISTNGTYVFITDHSGIGNGHIEPTVGQYEVEKLNDCLVRLISESLK